MQQLQTAEQPTAPRQRDTDQRQPQQNYSKTNQLSLHQQYGY